MNQQLEELRENRQDKVAGFFKYFSVIMGVFYMGMGLVFYFFPLLPEMDTWAKIALSLLLFSYGIFRIKRAIWS